MIVGVDKVADKTFDYVVIGMFVLPLLEFQHTDVGMQVVECVLGPTIPLYCLTRLRYPRRRD